MYDSFCTIWMASKWLWCIFQLPLISGRRLLIAFAPRRAALRAFGPPLRRACICAPPRRGVGALRALPLAHDGPSILRVRCAAERCQSGEVAELEELER